MPKTSLRYERGEFESRVQNLVATFDIYPHEWDLYYLAFVHRSVLNESSQGYIESNERLEFLGDAVLELIITQKLYNDFPKKPEGDLTDIRSALVRGRNLANVAQNLDIPEVVQLSRGEFRVGGNNNPYILANTVEAIIGAIYLDAGFAKAKEWILKYIYPTLDYILRQGLYVDPKSYLQELTQEIWGILPLYEVFDEEGEDHNKVYKIRVILGTQIIGEGKGTSKKKGEQNAAENAIIARNKWEHSVVLPKNNE